MPKRVDLKNIRTIPLDSRKCKVSIKDFAVPGKKRASFKDFYDSLPNILTSNNFKAIVEALVAAHKNDKMVIFMMGAHVIK
ncbi:MAG: hypothetical protein PHP46_04185, partial [Candidatus Omnitrophica bacterium]|nr:hypothetical protein [Candidatus Omnitrophota bacterium]